MTTPTSSDQTFPGQTTDGGDSQSTSRAQQAGRKAADALDQKRESVARGIDAAASSLRTGAERIPGGERIAGAAQTAADAMERAAEYVRDQDVETMLSDVRQAVKRHPGAVLLTAVAVGFLLARSFTRH